MTTPENPEEFHGIEGEIPTPALEMSDESGPPPDYNAGRAPGLKNLLVVPEQTNSVFNGVRYMARGSTRAEEYLPMTDLTNQEVARDMRITASLNLVNFGNMDIPHIMWLGYLLKVSVDRQGRREVEHMVIGDRARASEERRRGFGAMQNRARNMEPRAIGGAEG